MCVCVCSFLDFTFIALLVYDSPTHAFECLLLRDIVIVTVCTILNCKQFLKMPSFLSNFLCYIIFNNSQLSQVAFCVIEEYRFV